MNPVTYCKFCNNVCPPQSPAARRKREFCSAACKHAHWYKTRGSPAEPQLPNYLGETRVCKTCQLALPYSTYHKTGKTLKSGKKCYWYGNNCRMCEYEVQKIAKHEYYLKNKHLKKSTVLVANWRAKQAKHGNCQGCSQKLGFKARLCRNCYIGHWISGVADNTKSNKWKDLPAEDLRQRVTVLRQHKHILIKLPGADGYPNNRLGHIIPVRKDPWKCLLATNIGWMKHKKRGKQIA